VVFIQIRYQADALLRVYGIIDVYSWFHFRHYHRSEQLYALSHGLPYILITDSPYFYLALTLMILGTQLFLAGFIGELIARNAPERNNYKIEKEF